MLDETVASRTRCSVCNRKALRLDARRALEQAVAHPGRFRKLSVPILFAWLKEKHQDYDAQTDQSLTDHLKDHETDLYRAFLEVRRGGR